MDCIIKLLFLVFFGHTEEIYGQVTNKCFREDYTCLARTRSFYKIHPDRRNWLDAKEVCWSEGATLWYGEDQVETNAVISYWVKTQPSIEFVFTGISDLAVKSEYETVDGRPLADVFNFWSPNEPNDANGVRERSKRDERCLVLVREGRLNDMRCFSRTPFICRKKLESLVANATCDKTLGADGQPSKDCFREDYTYLGNTRSFYKLHTAFRNWYDAKKICATEGASLWYPEDEREVNEGVNFWLQQQPRMDWVFVGISDLIVRGVYETIDGRPLSDVFNTWNSGEPNDGGGNGGEEHCLILRRGATYDDHRCNLNFPFICKKTFDSLPMDSKCKTDGQPSKGCFREDYTYLEKQKSFYKLHTIQRHWLDAKNQCAMEGASLWYPEDEDEANEGINFWLQQQSHYEWVYVGISDLLVRGVYETIDGRPMEEIHDKWSPNEPNEGQGEERCLMIRREGNLHDHRCSFKMPFICKQTLDHLTMKGNCATGGKVNKNCFREDYTYIERTKSFYKLHTIHCNWLDAKKQCAMEGARLWYGEDQIEVNAVIAYWVKTGPDFQSLHYGISDLSSNRGAYETVDGRSMDDVFNFWAPGEPNDAGNTGGDERCLILRRQGTHDDHRCNMRFPFICRKKFDATNENCNCDEHNQGSRPQLEQAQPQPQQPTPIQLIRPQATVSSVATSSAECGVISGGNGRQPLIFNGRTYPRGEWPWIAALFRKRGPSLSFTCSGTLVSERHVLTAAHCMQVRNSATAKKDIIVRVGVHNLEDWGDDISISRSISVATFHERYNSTTLANDILVLTLERVVEFNTNIRPACLWRGNPDQSLIIGGSGVVVGWGLSELGPEGQGEPRIARLPVVSTLTCRASKPDFHKLTSEYTLCAGDRNGVGPCLGDSGGGFYMIERGRWQLRGIVSLSLRSEDSDKSCNLNEYLIFTDAAKYINWIRGVIAR